MPSHSLRGQLRVLTMQLPGALRAPILNAVNAIPELALPGFVPTINGGNSLTLNLQSPLSGRATQVTLPTPVDGLRVIESALPEGVPRLTAALGFAKNGGVVQNGATAPPPGTSRASSERRPTTTSRPITRTSQTRNGTVHEGGYRST